MKPVTVTPRPTEITHSQMVARNLLQAGERLGHDIDVETQGMVGTQDELASDAVAEADAVIVTSDTSVNHNRFDSKFVLKGMVKDGVNNIEVVAQKATGLAEASKTDSVTFRSNDNGGGTDIGADDSSDDTDAAESDELMHRGSDPEKELFARLKKLFS